MLAAGTINRQCGRGTGRNCCGVIWRAGRSWRDCPWSISSKPRRSAICTAPCARAKRTSSPRPICPDEVFERLVRESGETAEHMMLIGLGEPFMDPHIFERIEFCHEHSISTLLSTNGTFLDEKIADAPAGISAGTDHAELRRRDQGELRVLPQRARSSKKCATISSASPA